MHLALKSEIQFSKKNNHQLVANVPNTEMEKYSKVPETYANTRKVSTLRSCGRKSSNYDFPLLLSRFNNDSQ